MPRDAFVLGRVLLGSEGRDGSVQRQTARESHRDVLRRVSISHTGPNKWTDVVWERTVHRCVRKHTFPNLGLRKHIPMPALVFKLIDPPK